MAVRVQGAACGVSCVCVGGDRCFGRRRGAAADEFRGRRANPAPRSWLAVLFRRSAERLAAASLRTLSVIQRGVRIPAAAMYRRRLMRRRETPRRYYQAAPQRQRGYQSAGQYYAVAPSQAPRGYQLTPRYYAVAPAQRAGVYQPQPQQYYAPAQQPGSYQPPAAQYYASAPAMRGRGLNLHRCTISSRSRRRRPPIRHSRSPRPTSRNTVNRNTASRNTVRCRSSCRNSSRAVTGRRPMRLQAAATWRSRSPLIRNTIVRSSPMTATSLRARSSSIPRTTFSIW